MNNKWSYDIIKEHASHYKTKHEFREYDYLAYDVAVKRKIINDFFEDVHKHWTIETAREEIKKYKYKIDIYKNNRSLYNFCYRNDLFDEFGISNINKDDIKRCVYVYVDEENKVAYVGLTSNKKDRHNAHKTGKRNGKNSKSPVFEYFKSVDKDVPEPIYLEEDLSSIDAQMKEDYYKNKYNNDGYYLLNKAPTGVGVGSLGSLSHKWNVDNAINEAKKYKSRKEFIQKCGGAYEYLRRNNNLNVLNDIFNLLHRRWDVESVTKESKKYHSRSEFQKKCKGAYNYALNNEMLDELFPIDNIRWTYDGVIEEAKKYENRQDFIKGCSGAYNYAYRHDFIKELFPISTNRWTDDSVREEAKKYENKKEFQKNCPGAYSYAYRNNIINDLYQNQRNEKQWTKELLIDEVKKYKNRREFQMGNKSAYNYAKKYNLLDEIMPLTITFWTEDKVIDESKKYKTRNEFKLGNNSAYNYARKHNMLDMLYKK